jgi:hypothetical protein
MPFDFFVKYIVLAGLAFIAVYCLFQKIEWVAA